MRKKRFFLALLAILWTGTAWAAPRWIFLYVGDGMGLAHRQLAESYQGWQSQEAEPAVTPLRMNGFPVQALVRTYSAESYITDSAAAATAFATGHRTMKGFHGALPDGTAVPSIADMARDRGWKVGLISTAPLNDATPGAFYAHTTLRDSYQVGRFLATSGFHFFGGGPFSKVKGAQGQDQDLKDLAAEAGFAVTDLEGAPLVPAEKPLLCLGPKAAVFDGSPYSLDDPRPILKELTELAIQRFQDAPGFFIMVEGGKIDWASHSNDTRAVIEEVLAFDEALQPALDFAAAHPQDTLILVTSDHETGGLSLGVGGRYDSNYGLLRAQKATNETIHLELKPLVERKAPFQEALAALQDIYGYQDLSDQELEALRRTWELTLIPRSERMATPEIYDSYGSYDPVILESQKILATRAGLGWHTKGHTAMPVPLSAFGEGAEAFAGFYDNVEIFLRLRELLGFDASSQLEALPPAP